LLKEGFFLGFCHYFGRAAVFVLIKHFFGNFEPLLLLPLFII
jgi:hypothetical protein